MGGDLTPSLQFPVVEFLVSNMVGKMPMFAQLGIEFQVETFPRLKPFSSESGDVIFRKGEIALDMMFLVEGRVEVFSTFHLEESLEEGTILTKGSCFGES